MGLCLNSLNIFDDVDQPIPVLIGGCSTTTEAANTAAATCDASIDAQATVGDETSLGQLLFCSPLGLYQRFVLFQ